jgi:glycosyltransferase involved in cell wall biosynthesis
VRLGLPVHRRILISVAALNRHHKRIDYLVEEVAALPEPRPYLLLVGEAEAETAALRRLARDRLGGEGHEFRTVPALAVPEHLRASDGFVLASVDEAQGRAAIEAAGQGLPCFVHDSAVMRFALDGYGRFADLTREGALTGLLRDLHAPDPELAVGIHRHVYERFSWDRLRPRYFELLTRVANNTVSSSTGEKVSRYIR